MSEEFTLKLNSPITEEQWDAITDVDFDHTEEIFFHTKHGKEVTFVKRKKGKWIHHTDWEYDGECAYECSVCGMGSDVDYDFCMRCGADMRGEADD